MNLQIQVFRENYSPQNEPAIQYYMYMYMDTLVMSLLSGSLISDCCLSFTLAVEVVCLTLLVVPVVDEYSGVAL